MKNYLNSEDFDIKKSCILTAPTGTGKSTALIKHIIENNKQCIFVSPINPLGQQIYEKANGYFKIINCNNKEISILADIVSALKNNKSIIISLTTFIKYRELFYDYNIYIDECHLIIEYSTLLDCENLVKDIRNKKFKQIICITATPLKLDSLLLLPIIKLEVYPINKKYITLHQMKDYSLSSLIGNIKYLWKLHGKLVVFYNSTGIADKISQELNALNIKTKLYNSKIKEINIINEYFSEDFDILLCTSSLVSGVSIRDNYYSVYIHQSFDSINTIPQFFSRNRNIISKGCIIKRFYSYKQEDDIQENNYYGKTKINNTLLNTYYKYLNKLNTNLNKYSLLEFINEYNDYEISEGFDLIYLQKLIIEQQFCASIPNQKEYFIENLFSKFDKVKYKNLAFVYYSTDLMFNGSNNKKSDEIIEEYISNYIENNGSEKRENIFDYFYPLSKQYKTDKGILLANEANLNSINIEKFEEKFLNKEYNKKEFKDYCVKKFVIKEEILKNQKTIEQFLNKLGYCFKRGKTGSVIRKIQK